METKSKTERIVPFMAVHPGEILQAELLERGIRQKDFAQRIGMQPSHLSALIHGKRNISPSVAMRLEEALGISAASWLAHQHGYDVDKAAIQRRSHSQENLLERIAVLEEKVNHLMAALAGEGEVPYKPKE
ncbi:MAG: HigA family addiction module antitoxin [Bacteroidales bacterium]|nr:HigA family addiction module antitoxin [Bacteroidales bacterium]